MTKYQQMTLPGFELTEAERRQIRGHTVAYMFRDEAVVLDEHTIHTLISNEAVAPDGTRYPILKEYYDTMIPKKEQK